MRLLFYINLVVTFTAGIILLQSSGFTSENETDNQLAKGKYNHNVCGPICRSIRLAYILCVSNVGIVILYSSHHCY